MSATMVMTLVAWIWVLAGVAILGMVAYLKLTEDGNDLPYFMVLGTAAAAGVGAVAMGLRAAGWGDAALWAFRIGSSAYLLLTAARARLTSETAPRVWAGAAYDVGLAVVLASAAFTVGDVLPGQANTPGPVRPPYEIDFTRTWQGIALAMLAIGTLFFLFLFVRTVERGVAPQVESHWGGIGGGVGGWRMSASLTYLIAALAFGLLFGVFVSRLADDGRGGGGTAAATSTAQKPPAAAAKR